MTGFLQGDAELGVELQQRAGDAVGYGAGLGARAAAGDVGDDVKLVLSVGRGKRGGGATGEIVVLEIGVEIEVVGGL